MGRSSHANATATSHITPTWQEKNGKDSASLLEAATLHQMSRSRLLAVREALTTWV